MLFFNKVKFHHKQKCNHPPIHHSPDTPRNKGRNFAYIIIAIFIGLSVIGVSIWYFIFANKELSYEEIYYQSLDNTALKVEPGVAALSRSVGEADTLQDINTRQVGDLVYTYGNAYDGYIDDFFLNIMHRVENVRFTGQNLNGDAQYLFTFKSGYATVLLDVILPKFSPPSKNPKIYVKFRTPESLWFSSAFYSQLDLTPQMANTLYNHLDKWWVIEDSPYTEILAKSLTTQNTFIVSVADNVVPELKSIFWALREHVFTRNQDKAIFQIPNDPKPISKERVLRYQVRLNVNNSSQFIKTCSTRLLSESSTAECSTFLPPIIQLDDLDARDINDNYSFEIWIDASEKTVIKIQISSKTDYDMSIDFNIKNPEKEIGVDFVFNLKDTSSSVSASMIGGATYNISANTLNLKYKLQTTEGECSLEEEAESHTISNDNQSPSCGPSFRPFLVNHSLNWVIEFVETDTLPVITIPQNAKPFSELLQ